MPRAAMMAAGSCRLGWIAMSIVVSVAGCSVDDKQLVDSDAGIRDASADSPGPDARPLDAATGPVITLDAPSYLVPGPVMIGANATVVIHVKNEGGTRATGFEPTAQPGGPLSIASNLCGTMIDPGVTCDVTVRFAPIVAGAYAGPITIDANEVAPQMPMVTGTGAAQVSVMVTSDGNGAGTVTSTPPGLGCSGMCTHVFTESPVASWKPRLMALPYPWRDSWISRAAVWARLAL